MRRLTPRQGVTLSLDGDEEVIDGQVLSVSGPVALLDCVDAAPIHLRARLSPGSMCMMAFTHHGKLVGLRGVVTAASEDLNQLAFIVADGVQVEERRLAERIALVIPVRIRTVTGPGAVEPPSVETVTVDISLGGALVERREGARTGPRFRLELYLGDDPVPVSTGADLVRATATHLGLRFIDIPALDRIRLASFLAEHQLGSSSA